MFLNSINYFRGIAILAIVTGHCYTLAGFDPWHGNASVWERAIANLISGGTVFFVFISGFMFHHVFYQRGFQYWQFLKSKWLNVGVPYLAMSVLPISSALWVTPPPLLAQSTEPSGWAILVYLITGQHLIGYWYIPFALLLFFASPAFLWFLRSRYQLLVMGLGFGLSLWVHRPWLNLNPFHSLLYFTPVYLFGMWASLHRGQIYQRLHGKTIYLLFVVFVLAILQALLHQEVGSLHRQDNWQLFSGVDINLIQKILLCLFFMVWLHFNAEKQQIVWLDRCAKLSFPIYFLHAYWVTGLERLGLTLQWGNVVGAIAVGLGITLLCMGMARFIQRWLPAYSRRLIGA